MQLEPTFICTPFRNTGESMVVDFEKTDQFSSKSHISFKFSKGLSSIGVKKNGLNLPNKLKTKKLMFYQG